MYYLTEDKIGLEAHNVNNLEKVQTLHECNQELETARQDFLTSMDKHILRTLAILKPWHIQKIYTNSTLKNPYYT